MYDTTYLRRLLKGRGITGKALAEIINASKSTGARRMKYPETLTVGELYKIVLFTDISADEIKAALVLDS